MNRNLSSTDTLPRTVRLLGSAGFLVLAVLAVAVRYELEKAAIRHDAAQSPAGLILAPGLPPPAVFYPQDAPLEIVETARDAARILSVMSGQDCQALVESIWTGRRGLYLGRTHLRSQIEATSGNWPSSTNSATGPADHPLPAGTVGYFISGGRVIVGGSDAEADAESIYWWLDRFGGVRWFTPSPADEDIPRLNWWALENSAVVETPAFAHRWLQIGNSPADRLWQRRNLLRQSLSYHHNLVNLFKTEDWARHPDWLPMEKGQTYHPANPNDYHWQPNFTKPAVAEHVAGRALDFFENNPDALSFSIGINDSLRYGDEALAAPSVNPRRYLRGRPDLSDLVFAFNNSVAGQVERVFPNKLLGCLAYHWAENVPSFPVHPNVAPVVTADRAQSFDPAFRESDRELLERWGRAGARVWGTYDYVYGASYILPRNLLTEWGEGMERTRSAGGSVWTAELYPIWGYDAPKAWWLARAAWDGHPETAGGDWADEFYERYYGPAATPMKMFFDLAAEAWRAQTGSSRWLKYYADPHQVVLWPTHLRVRLKAALDRAAHLARSPHHRNRVASARQAFQFTATFCEVLEAGWALRRFGESSPRVVDEVLLFERYLTARHHWEETIQTVEDSAANGALLQPAWNRAVEAIEPFLVKAWDRIGESAMALNHWEMIHGLGASSGHPDIQRAVTVLATPGLHWSGVLARNGGLEHPVARFASEEEKRLPHHWRIESIENEGLDWRRTPEAARSGLLGWECRHASWLQMYQTVWVEPDSWYVWRGWVRGRIAPASSIVLRLFWLNAAGQVIGKAAPDRLPPGAGDDWFQLTVLGCAPGQAKGAALTLEVAHQEEDDWLQGDDFSLQLLEPSTSP